MSCRLCCRVRDREHLQMIVMEFLTMDDRYYFSAAAQAELFASFTRCGCGCHKLADMEKQLPLPILAAYPRTMLQTGDVIIRVNYGGVSAIPGALCCEGLRTQQFRVASQTSFFTFCPFADPFVAVSALGDASS